MSMRFVVCVAVFCGLLSGCATLTEEECQILNWEAEGREAGEFGGGPTSYSRLASQCSRYAIAPDYDAFERGRQQGLVRFCTPDGVYIAGLAGRGSTAQCAAGDPNLTLIHQTALNYTRATRELSRARNALEQSIRYRNNAREDVFNLRRRLRDEEDPEEIENLERRLRRELRLISQYEIDEARLFFEIADRERALTRAEFDLDRVRSEFGLGFGPYSYY
ncbi:MAG: DUF2799 domain-containing protein [Pseudomonadota bacterium]